MGTITAADVVVTIQQATLFPAPRIIQGFATDDVFDVDAIQSVETQMGVDGILSGGFVFAPIIQNIALQADSESNDVFDTLWAQQQATKSTYPCSGLIVVPAVSKKYAFALGFLTTYKPLADAKRVLQPRRYGMTWGRLNVSPV